MYDELVKHLRFCGKCNDATECDYCEYNNTTEYVDRVCSDRLMLQAADAIEELSKAQEQWIEQERKVLLQSIHRWIPVEERLPEEGKFVLVYGDLYPNKHDGGVIAVSKRMDWNYWQGFGRERDITHWMPLPTPPTAEEGE